MTDCEDDLREALRIAKDAQARAEAAMSQLEVERRLFSFEEAMKHPDYPFAAEEEEILAKERVLPCRGCTHQMRHHDEDDRCTLCPCPEFRYEETE